MMNEYHCRNYLAEQVLEELSKSMLQNRIGKPFSIRKMRNDTLYSRRSQNTKSNVVNDVGSAKYQEWLSK